MPGGLHFFETALPRAADANGKSVEEQLAGIYNYLYMLLEQLRYTLSNLDGSNINAAALSGFQKLITEPINVRLEDAEGNIHTLEITAGALDSRITQETVRADGVEQQLSSRITQTAESIVSEVTRATAAEGALSSRITQTAEEISSRVSTAEGNISTLTQTAQSLSSRVQSAEGNISTLSQTASGLAARVSNAEGDISSLEQTATGLSVSVSGLEDAQSTTLFMTSQGVVVKGSSGAVTISGSQIDADGLTIGKISSGSRNYAEMLTDGFYVYTNDTLKFGLEVESENKIAWQIGRTDSFPFFIIKEYYGGRHTLTIEDGNSSNDVWIQLDHTQKQIIMNATNGLYFNGTRIA